MTDERDVRRDREIANLRAEAGRLRAQLALLSKLSRRIASSLDIGTVFQDVVDAACELTDARYGALAVFDTGGRIEQFITSGLTQEERDRIGRPPEGLGILGWLQHVQEPILLADLRTHPRSSGFPPNHPLMTTFLGAPIRHGDERLGNLYLTEKAGGGDFTPEDESLLVLFAAQAAMAIRNARQHKQLQDFALLEERERIAMDLHDSVIQSLFATGLRLESSAEDVAQEQPAVAAELVQAIDRLNKVIADIRSYIFDLRPGSLTDRDLAGAIGMLLQELKVNALINVALDEEPDACRGLTEEQITSLFHIAEEALTNVRKHAKATSVTVRLGHQDGAFRLVVSDNGCGLSQGGSGRGQGLPNMRDRATALGGRLVLEYPDGGGTRLTVEVPAR